MQLVGCSFASDLRLQLHPSYDAPQLFLQRRPDHPAQKPLLRIAEDGLAAPWGLALAGLKLPAAAGHVVLLRT